MDDLLLNLVCALGSSQRRAFGPPHGLGQSSGLTLNVNLREQLQQNLDHRLPKELVPAQVQAHRLPERMTLSEPPVSQHLLKDQKLRRRGKHHDVGQKLDQDHNNTTIGLLLTLGTFADFFELTTSMQCA